jgi:hypothetical protein
VILAGHGGFSFPPVFLPQADGKALQKTGKPLFLLNFELIVVFAPQGCTLSGCQISLQGLALSERNHSAISETLPFLFFDLLSPNAGVQSIDPDYDARLPQFRGQHL